MSIVQICVTCHVDLGQQGQVKTLALTLCKFTGYPSAYATIDL